MTGYSICGIFIHTREVRAIEVTVGENWTSAKGTLVPTAPYRIDNSN